MKRRIIPLFIAATLPALSGCFFHSDTEVSVLPGNGVLQSRAYAVYDYDGYAQDEGKTSLAAYALGHMDVHYAPIDLVPYMTLKEYFTMLARNMDKKYTITFGGSTAYPTVSVYSGNELTYLAEVSYRTFRAQYAGSLSVGKQKGGPETSLSVQLKASQKTLVSGSNSTTFSFSSMRTPIYTIDEDYYMPLAMWDAIFTDDTDAIHFCDGDSLYQIKDADYLGKTIGGVCPSDKIKLRYGSTGVPESLGKLRADCFYAEMVNRYGLTNERGVSNMGDFLKERGVYSSNGSIQSIVDVYGDLDDDHSGLVSLCGWYGEKISQGSKGKGYWRGENSVARDNARSQLSAARTGYRKNKGLNEYSIEYSSDGVMAKFALDSFRFSSDAYVDGQLREDIWKEDDYFYFVHQMEEIVAHGGVTDVVVDLSLNGGGTIGVLYKILALMSKENTANIDLKFGNTGTVVRVTASVDPNGDGVYSKDETYGSRFSFFLLTSRCSFSCGNALPFLAAKQNFAKTMGENSGGGECTVNSRILPTGNAYAHSSMMHMGISSRNGTVFEGDENGAGINYSLPYSSFNSIDEIHKAVYGF